YLTNVFIKIFVIKNIPIAINIPIPLANKDKNNSNETNVPGKMIRLMNTNNGDTIIDIGNVQPENTIQTNARNGPNTIIKLNKPRLIAARTALTMLPVVIECSTFSM